MVSHQKLVKMARAWLMRKCCVVITELCGGAGEEADAIGWSSSGHSTLIECKASRADFLSDSKKVFRRNPTSGMGHHRYYLCPQDVIKTPEELPLGWGYLLLLGGKIRQVAPSMAFQEQNYYEKAKLLTLLRRIGHNAPPGVNVKTYSFDPIVPVKGQDPQEQKMRATACIERGINETGD